ncbi:unnamed protein product [Gongylonema pulchrum]|uniref:Uncharacterized protein n=1 Tax=Gongylonema pulchrum TaxID=637853 RepID=A0A3P7NDB0_9BILA|nr:unnamed protein product [Gongylonema pulchrum]
MLTRHMRLDQSHSKGSGLSPSQHRNMCIVLGCLAEKLAGPSSAEICCDATLNYLIDNLKPASNCQVILYSLIALEKLAQTIENRLTICERLERMKPNPLLVCFHSLGKLILKNFHFEGVAPMS